MKKKNQQKHFSYQHSEPEFDAFGKMIPPEIPEKVSKFISITKDSKAFDRMIRIGKIQSLSYVKKHQKRINDSAKLLEETINEQIDSPQGDTSQTESGQNPVRENNLDTSKKSSIIEIYEASKKSRLQDS